MLKSPDPVKIEQQALDLLYEVLGEVPGAELLEVRAESSAREYAPDYLVRLGFNGEQRVLVVEVKSSGQPRHVQSALFQLQRYMEGQPPSVIPVFVAPYLSEAARELCTKSNVGYMDFEGNALITFPGFFLSRKVAGKPSVERRELRSLFKPKSAQVMRTMMRDPARAWRVADLAKDSFVSLGHVSNVRNSLLDRGWAEVSEGGLILSNPDGLLDAWREEYVPPAGERRTFYTTLHGSAFEAALREYGDVLAMDGLAILASFSAANWLAPYARTGTHHFYADQEGVDRMRKLLKLTTPTRGENVVVIELDDPALFQDSVEPTEGIHCTSPLQTYLDLWASGERGREAAEHLRQERLQWRK
ncbi:type IV toxin-antitoxin system AbiEi family antitoxin [Roseateles sp. P5_E11]